MKLSFMRILLTSVVFAGFSANALAEDCGMRDREFWGLEYAVQNSDTHNEKKKIVENVLKDSAISTSQAIELIALFDKKQDDVAIKIYPAVCDPENWTNIYAIPQLQKKRKRIENSIQELHPRSANYNRKNHSDWYNSNGSWNNAGWNSNHNHPTYDPVTAAAAQTITTTGFAIQAELERERKESSELKKEIERLKAEKERANREQELADAYKKGYDEGYRRGYSDSKYETANSCRIMSDSAFNSLIRQLDNIIGTEKEKVLESAASINNFSCEQAKLIIKTMSFKSSEENAAVILYPRICDPENWFTVYDAFSFEFSISEVNKRLNL